jgi:hypothetical protein
MQSLAQSRDCIANAVVEIDERVSGPQPSAQLFSGNNPSWLGSKDGENVEWESRDGQTNSPPAQFANGHIEFEDPEANHFTRTDDVGHGSWWGSWPNRSGLGFRLTKDMLAQGPCFQKVSYGQKMTARGRSLGLT